MRRAARRLLRLLGEAAWAALRGEQACCGPSGKPDAPIGCCGCRGWTLYEASSAFSSESSFCSSEWSISPLPSLSYMSKRRYTCAVGLGFGFGFRIRSGARVRGVRVKVRMSATRAPEMGAVETCCATHCANALCNALWGAMQGGAIDM